MPTDQDDTRAAAQPADPTPAEVPAPPDPADDPAPPAQDADDPPVVPPTTPLHSLSSDPAAGTGARGARPASAPAGPVLPVTPLGGSRTSAGDPPAGHPVREAVYDDEGRFDPDHGVLGLPNWITGPLTPVRPEDAPELIAEAERILAAHAAAARAQEDSTP